MKACTVFVASAVVAMLSIDSAMGLAKYLQEIPNGDTFAKSLGHTADAYTAFGTAFSKGGATWTADFCKAMFPGTTISNGAAFGDPCCTWKKGGKPDKTVTAFTDKPTVATECAAATPAATPAVTPAAAPAAAPTTAPAASSAAPAGKPSTPAAGPTPAPAGKPASGTTPAPAGKPSVPAPVPGGKPSKCKVKEEKSLDDEEEETNSDNDSEEIPDY